jgi:AraC-like DNA-binding protein|tara:strand:+ start:3101 stop:4252 length:1152 start_codon:yes stop_codon:yes gene_type:complete
MFLMFFNIFFVLFAVQKKEYMAGNSVLMLIFLIIMITIFNKRSDSNKFHLDYFLYHLCVLFLFPILYLSILFFDTILNKYFFALGGAIHILSFILMTLHIQSSVKGYRVKIKIHHILPFVIYIFLCILDFFYIYLFKFPTAQSKFYDIEINNQLSFNNILLIKQAISIYLYAYLFYSYRKSIKNSSTIKKKNIYTTWVYSYVTLFICSFVSTSSLFFGLFDSSYDGVLIIINKIIAMANIFYFLATPSALMYLPLIRIEGVLYENKNNLSFDLLKSLFETEEIFLDKTLCLRNVSLTSGLGEITIRILIKKNTGLSFNDFVNGYRIEYAIEIMKSDFLDANLMSALGEKSGFKSNHTFYRAFKKRKDYTPSYYYKTYLQSRSS